MESSFASIIVAAGSGLRMGGEEKKQFLKLQNIPMVLYSVLAFKEAGIDNIVVVVGQRDVLRMENMLFEHKVEDVKVTIGGECRGESVYAGLCATEADYVMIHDAARPFVDNKIITRCMEAVCEFDAVVTVMPVKDTIKISHGGIVDDTPDRRYLFAAQTPQCFKYSIIKDAYEQAINHHVIDRITDDSMAVETFGSTPVYMLPGGYYNIKITEPGDLALAEHILNQ